MIAFIKEQLAQAGKLSLFTGRFFREVFSRPFQINEFLRQCYTIGFKSLPLVTITGFIMGLVLTIQSRPTMSKFGADEIARITIFNFNSFEDRISNRNEVVTV